MSREGCLSRLGASFDDMVRCHLRNNHRCYDRIENSTRNNGFSSECRLRFRPEPTVLDTAEADLVAQLQQEEDERFFGERRRTSRTFENEETAVAVTEVDVSANIFLCRGSGGGHDAANTTLEPKPA